MGSDLSRVVEKPGRVVLPDDQAAALRAAMASWQTRATVAERLRMRLEGAKADLLDASDALRALWAPIAAAHGLDPDGSFRVGADGAVEPQP